MKYTLIAEVCPEDRGIKDVKRLQGQSDIFSRCRCIITVDGDHVDIIKRKTHPVEVKRLVQKVAHALAETTLEVEIHPDVLREAIRRIEVLEEKGYHECFPIFTVSGDFAKSSKLFAATNYFGFDKATGDLVPLRPRKSPKPSSKT